MYLILVYSSKTIEIFTALSKMSSSEVGAKQVLPGPSLRKLGSLSAIQILIQFES